MKTTNHNKLTGQRKIAKIVLSAVGILFALMVVIAIFAPKETTEDTNSNTAEPSQTETEVARRAIHDNVEITNTKVILGEDGSTYKYVFIAKNNSESNFNGEVRLTLHSNNTEGQPLVQRFTFNTSLEPSKSTFLSAESSSAPKYKNGSIESYSYELFSNNDANRGSDDYKEKKEITSTFESL